MSLASLATIPTGGSANLLVIIADGVTRTLAGVKQQRERARTRKITSMLTIEQMRDAGIDQWSILPAGPVIRIEAGLMANLSSMR